MLSSCSFGSELPGDMCGLVHDRIGNTHWVLSGDNIPSGYDVNGVYIMLQHGENATARWDCKT